MRKALVLGGGGVVGNAWEVGLVCGLAQAGVDLRSADTIVGTSAGSIVGTRLAAGEDLSQPVTTDVADRELPFPADGPDLAVLGELFPAWASQDVVTPEFCQRIGGLALKARTAAAEEWIAAIGEGLGIDAWPEADLRLIAVDVDSGERVVLCPNDEIGLHQAAAASCSVPGLFPVIEAGGHRLTDGGLHSGTSADVLLVDEPGVAVIVAPIVSGTAAFGDLASRCLDAEIASLKAAGWQVLRILPTPPEKSIFGPDLMDAERADAARDAGVERGEIVAGLLKNFW